MKLNWGTGIVLTLIIFVAGMLTLVIISTSQNLNLVDPNYYPESIDYQKQITKNINSSKLKENIVVFQDKNFIYVKFPKLDSINKPQGNILLFHPADNHYDKKYTIKTNDSLFFIISKDSLVKGFSIVKVDWNIDTTSFYKEQQLSIY